MRTMRVLRLAVHTATRQPMLLLGEADGDRCLPVFLRPAQAEAISVGPRAQSADTHLTQDVLVPVVEALGRRLERAELTDLTDGVYSAELVFDQDVRVPVLPSDALAVAVREELPIGVADEILDEVGQPVAELFPDGGDAPPADQLREFRAFIDEVSPDDFADPPGS